MSDQNRYVNWRKSSASTDGSGCVEVSTDVPGTVAVRDSKLGEESPILVYTDHEWRMFKLGIAAGEF